MPHFSRSERDQRGGSSRRILLCASEVLLDRDADQEGVDEQDQGHVPIPAEEVAHFILVQTEILTGLQILVG